MKKFWISILFHYILHHWYALKANLNKIKQTDNKWYPTVSIKLNIPQHHVPFSPK